MLREVLFNDWYTTIIIASLTIIVIAKLLNPNRFVEFMKLIGNSNYLRIHFKDHRFFDPFDVFLFINFCINAVLTGIIAYRFYESNVNINFVYFIKLVAILGIGFLLKILLELAVGAIFEIEKISHSYVFQQISTLNFLGVLLLPLNVLLVFSFPNQFSLLVITLVIIYFVLSKIALPRIASVLSDRQMTISNDIARAEDLKQSAIEAENAYNLALSEARAEAQMIIDEAKAEIKQELLEATEKADVEISKRAAESEKAILEMRKGALKAVEEVANDTAQAILAKVMPSLNDEKTIKKAVSDRMKE